jgi:hypothetical protein
MRKDVLTKLNKGLSIVPEIKPNYVKQSFSKVSPSKADSAFSKVGRPIRSLNSTYSGLDYGSHMNINNQVQTVKNSVFVASNFNSTYLNTQSDAECTAMTPK